MVRQTKYNHSTVVVLPDDPTKAVSESEWNDGHNETGMTGHNTTTLTISSGSITPINDMHIIDGEGAADDNLDAIINTETAEFDEILLYAGAQIITVRNGVVNMFTLSGESIQLSTTVPTKFIRKGTGWFESGGSTASNTITHKFITPETFSALSGLTSENIKVIHVDTTDVTSGFIAIEVDAVQVKSVALGIEDTSLIITPSVSVDVISDIDKFDITDPVFLQSFSVAAQENAPTSMAFNNDGSKMYVVGTQNDSVHEYNLSTNFDISTSVFLQSFSISTQTTTPTGMTFNNDGSKMYVIGPSSVHEYDLSTNFDISTSVFLQSFSVAVQDGNPEGMAFNTDGSKMYMVGLVSDSVHEYDLSTNFDISTSVFLQSFSVAVQDAAPRGMDFNNDGSKMYMVGGGGSVHEYDLSTNFDISTSVFSKSFSVLSEETAPRGMAFNNDGSKIYIVGISSDSVHEYDITFAGTAFIVII